MDYLIDLVCNKYHIGKMMLFVLALNYAEKRLHYKNILEYYHHCDKRTKSLVIDFCIDALAGRCRVKALKAKVRKAN